MWTPLCSIWELVTAPLPAKKKKRVKNFLGPHSRSLLRSPGDCLEPRTGRLRW